MIAALLLALAAPATQQPAAAARPNLLWITSEDHGPHLGCYGDADAVTPRLDALAAEGVRFERVWSNAPVCAPARTALITGVWPPSLGAQDMRTLVEPPAWLRFLPELLREAGYACTNNRKEDYNLAQPRPVWDESGARAHWRQRAPGQPFFAVFNFGITHESQIRKRPHDFVHDPAEVRVPAFHPDLPEVREDWAEYHDRISQLDARVGELLDQLEADGLAEDTIVFFFSDHGPGLSRCKRWPYDSGLRVPLIVRVPEKWRGLAPRSWTPGGVGRQLVDFLDLAPTALSLAGVAPPEWMHGTPFLGPHVFEAAQLARPSAAFRDHLFGFRGRMDERLDLVRSVTDGRFVYVRNFLPHLPQGQFLEYENETPTTRAWRAAFEAGGLPPHLQRYWLPKPDEELYDLARDPDEVQDLAGDPAHAADLARLRARLAEWMLHTGDLGLMPEAQMHAAAAARGVPPAVLAGDAELYPLERLLRQTAAPPDDAAPAAGPPAVLWWSWLLRIQRGRPALAELRAAAGHPDPSVRLLVLEELARRGDAADRARAVPALIAACDPARSGPWLALAAWNAVDRLDALVEPWRAELEAIPTTGLEVPPRVAPNFAKLRARTLAELDALAPR